MLYLHQKGRGVGPAEITTGEEEEGRRGFTSD
jgi:hypothetical protein